MGNTWDRRVMIQGSPMVERLDASDGGCAPLDTKVEAPRGLMVVRVLAPVPLAPSYRVVVTVADRGGIPHHVGGMPALTAMGGLNPSVICDACRRTGHVAANCDALAIALFIEKYKKDLPDDTKDRIETD